MPSAAASVMAAADLVPQGVVKWMDPVSESAPGIYVVALTQDPTSTADALPRPPVSTAAIEQWLRVRPELRLDGRRPTITELAERVSGFWLPDEVVLYIGLAGTSLRNRIGQYYRTPLGARRPHAGGHFLKTLESLSDLYVHWALTDNPSAAEDRMLRAFCADVSRETREELLDPDHPFPFANLEWPAGVRKRHGLTGTKGDLGGSSKPAAVTETAPVTSGLKVARRSVTLHAEVARILREHDNRWMTTSELARAVNDAANYRKKDGTPVTAFQIHGRTRKYGRLFERAESRVRLRDDAL